MRSSSAESSCSRAGSASAATRGGEWWDWLGYVLLLVVFVVFALLTSFVGTVLSLLPRRFATVRRAQGFIARVFSLYLRIVEASGLVRFRVSGAEKLCPLRGSVVVSNHPALWDVMLIIAGMPRAVCVMRGGLKKNPLFSGVAKSAGYITNDSGRGMIRQAVEKVRAGENLVIFPEGTRTRDGHALNPFKDGFAVVAREAGCPVVPVLIGHPSRILGKGRPLLAPGFQRFTVDVVVGEPFTLCAGESARELSARIEQWFRARLEAAPAGVSITLKP